MKNDLEETVIAAFMCKQPVILVEGQDDIKFYDNIATLKGIPVGVQASETIEGYSEGCEQVCSAMEEVVDWIKQDFEGQSNELYYFSLEALKKMCDNTYQAGITYGLDGGAVTGKAKQYRWSLIGPKTNDLDQFAMVHSISKNDLKYIAKGKWFLATWCDYLIKKAKILYSVCGKQIPQCTYCKVGQPNKCLWRLSSSFQVVEIESLLYTQQFIDLNEVNYIFEYMKYNLAC